MLRERSDNLEQENKVWKSLETYFQTWRQDDSYDKWVQAESLRPRLTVSHILLYLLSTACNLVSLGFWVLVVVVWVNAPSLDVGVLLIIGLLVMFGITFRPRFVQPEGEPMTRANFPHLFRFIDRVAKELGTEAPKLITYDSGSGVMFSRTGVKNEPWLKIGMALWMKMTPQDRVALIAHGLAHNRTGDIGRNLWVTNALLALHTWYELFFPAVPLGLKFDGTVWAIWSLVKIWGVLYQLILYSLFFVVTRPIYGLIWLFQLLMTDDTRRAEYYADEMTARISGTESAINLQYGLRSRSNDLHLYFSHPPVAYRIRFLEARPRQFPNVISSEAEMRQIDEELAKPYQHARRELDKLGVVDY